jgi:NAD(P)-dependent dehydrogenase (short-subunit alcohol dehydrogenase family)
MESLNGKVAVVTGGASGIGRALALAFAREGARVVVADLDDAGMADTVAEVARAGSAAIAVRTDVSRLEQVQALADRAFAEMGAVHVLCNNAGVALWGGLESATHRDWEWAIGVNLWGVIHGIEVFVPRMIAQHVPGHIVNTASMAGLIASQGLGVYNTTKYAVVGLSETLHKDLRAMGSACPSSAPWGSRRRSARARGTDPTACAMPARRTGGAKSI